MTLSVGVAYRRGMTTGRIEDLGDTLVDERPERSTDPFPDGALLQHFKLVGFQRRTYQAAPDAPIQPGGCCWHCGAGIMNCVIVEHTQTGQTETIGLDCAERIGLDSRQVRQMLRDRYAAERAEAKAASRERERAATARYGQHGTSSRHDEGGCRCKACVEANQHGDHGTLERYETGCRCTDCRTVAPHGTLDQFRTSECLCPACVQVAVEQGGYALQDRAILLHYPSCEPVEGARVVNGRYGQSWVFDSPNGTEWVSAYPKRRATITNKGYLEAPALFLVRHGRNGTYVVGQIEPPTVDNWDQPLGQEA